MTPALWSYALAAVGILGIVLAGQRRAAGWAIGLFAGFYVSALAYGVVYGRNWRKWRRESREMARIQPETAISGQISQKRLIRAFRRFWRV